MSNKPTDFDLVTAWRSGDVEAGEALLQRHYSAVRRFFVNRIGDDCEDLIQATFLGCTEAIGRFRAESSFRTLLFAIAWKKLCRHLRDHPRRGEEPGLEGDAMAMSHTTFGARIDASRQAELLRGAMRQLPHDTQIMLQLYYWEALSLQEIASVVERPLSTVKTRMRRGRLQLQDELQKLR